MYSYTVCIQISPDTARAIAQDKNMPSVYEMQDARKHLSILTEEQEFKNNLINVRSSALEHYIGVQALAQIADAIKLSK